jgi:hypothetical protein
MVIVKIVAVLVLLVGGLVVLQEQRVFERAGLTGGCDAVGAPIPDVPEAQWWSCREGILTGYPSLVKDNCVLRYLPTDRQVWRCPNAIEQPAALI